MSSKCPKQSSIQARLLDLRKNFPEELSKDEALELATQAVQLYIDLLRNSKNKREKTELNDTAKSLLDDAENIKLIDSQLWNYKRDMPPTLKSLHVQNPVLVNKQFKVRQLQVPESSRRPDAQEHDILSRGSALNGNIYPPWTGPPEPGEFHLTGDQTQYYDACNMQLFPLQKGLIAGWERPSKALFLLSQIHGLLSASESDSIDPIMYTNNHSDLVQDAASDCSVVASLCVDKARSERGHTEVLIQALYPNKALSPNGKYLARLNFNGCFRKVTIDDRLPISNTARALHVFDRGNPTLLGPALLEKAFLKIHGGYDFRGSNSGTDIWIMAGWIPEQIFLQHDSTDSDKLWAKMWKSFGFGDIMITVGTGKMTEQAERDTGLASEHDYAILDLEEIEGQRRFLIKNPWLNERNLCPLRNDETLTVHPADRNKSSIRLYTAPGVLPNGKSSHNEATAGTFRMSLNDVVQNFESVYLNWNPGLFSYRQDIHFTWDLSPTSGCGRSPIGSLSTNPQFVVSSVGSGPLWLLAWRHLTNRPIYSLRTEPKANEGFICLIAFENEDRRVYLSRGANSRSYYVDSPQTLLKLESNPGTTHVLALSEQDLPTSEHTFTLSAFSTCSMTLERAPLRYSHSTMVNSSWTLDNAGGNTSAITYSQNPQFSLEITSPTSIAIRLETPARVNIHVKLLHGHGHRMYSIAARDIMIDSGEYRPGCALAEYLKLVETGHYTIICSTFEPNQFAPFSLTVDSNSPASVKPIAREGAGRIKLQLKDAQFVSGVRALAAPLVPIRLAHFSLMAKYLESSDPEETRRSGYPPIRLSLEYGYGPDRRVLCQSQNGLFSDSSNGIRTDDLDLDPALLKQDQIWLIVERLGSGVSNERNELLGLELWTDVLDAIRVGDWRVWDS